MRIDSRIVRSEDLLMPAKTSQLQIRISPKDKARLRRLAMSAGMDVSSYLLSRALPDEAGHFAALTAELATTDAPAFVFAELHDLLSRCAAVDFPLLVETAPPARLVAWRANYLAAMVETAAHRVGLVPPAWVASIAPLETPWFAAPLRSLRPYLLRVSPPAFKRRNLFIDTTLGGRQ
jgi:hypothetical protein